MNDELIFHLHIPKTAGSSIRSALLDAGWVMANTFKIKSIADRRGNLISGHYMFGAFPFFRFGKRTTYVTVLRNPEERMISMYLYVKDRPMNPFYSLIRNGFRGFWRAPAFKNMQSRFIAGRLVSFLYGRGVIGDEMLFRIASKNLEKIAFVGIQEKLEGLLVDLKKHGIIDASRSSFEYRNVGQKDSQSEVMFGDELSSFKESNEVDYRIVRLARERSAGTG